MISIHAPREGGDLCNNKYTQILIDISIHAPREGGDVSLMPSWPGLMEFQSTPPARGATTTIACRKSALRISIHAPREGGDGCNGLVFRAGGISIHAPREGGDHAS